jgi:gamma-glutamylcyclotransferase (GGCT)/AIG2-like uncharacterized protein YtfP
MSVFNRNRRPAGQRTGGQFAPETSGRDGIPTAPAAPPAVAQPYAQQSNMHPMGAPQATVDLAVGEAFAAGLIVDGERLREGDIVNALTRWAETPNHYEVTASPDPRFAFQDLPGVPDDPSVRAAFTRLGYETYLSQPYPVFVYGTLRTGQHNNHLLADATVEAAPARMEGVAIYGSSYGFPYAATHGASDAVTVGEVMELTSDDAGLDARRRLDWLEGFKSDRPSDSHYERVLRDVQVTDPATRATVTKKAWVYLAGDGAAHRLPERERILHGDWVAAKRGTD